MMDMIQILKVVILEKSYVLLNMFNNMKGVASLSLTIFLHEFIEFSSAMSPQKPISKYIHFSLNLSMV